MASSAPEIYNYVYSSYHGSSALGFGDHVVMSSEGVQQGDPLGHLLFCAAVQPLLTGCNSELKVGYLDDFTIGGKSDRVVFDVEWINSHSAELGLKLNEQKCELIAKDNHLDIPPQLRLFNLVNLVDDTLLESPLMRGRAMD